MRPYSHYLDTIKNENIFADFNLGGSTPPLNSDWQVQSMSISQAESFRSPFLQNVVESIARKAHVKPENVGIFPGGSQTAFQVLAAATSPGDSILLESPIYEPFVAAAKFLNLKLKYFKRSGEFSVDIRRIEKKIRGCKIILISNPHCPTGHLYTAEELKIIAKKGKLVVDEVFLPMFANEITRSPLKNVISIGGLSKSLGLSSLRIGWAIGDVKKVQDIKRIGYNLHIDLPTASLQLADIAMQHWNDLISPNLRLADENRKLVESFAKRFPSIVPYGFSRGHFFVLKTPKRFSSGKRFAAHLLKQSIWVRPGEDFGMNGFVRISALIEPKYFNIAFGMIENFYDK